MAYFRLITSRAYLPLILMICLQNQAYSTDYFVHPVQGKDTENGTSRQAAFRTLERASEVEFLPGDRLLLAAGETFHGGLRLIDQHGSPDQPILITSVTWSSEEELIPAWIDFSSEPNGILLDGCSHIRVSNLQFSGNGFQQGAKMDYNMRCGLLITNTIDQQVCDIRLSGLRIEEIFFENEGFTRSKEEVRTANGTQRYGWGIRVINTSQDSSISAITIEHCLVQNVSHTGIKLTGRRQNIFDVLISGNEILETGGPGIQMSEVHDVHVIHNKVSHSGSYDDSRKWGRGSGLWTWGSSRVLIEKNSFLHANGPGDSAGAHIDFNCDNIILQYNLSAFNAGGFCEVLGNTYNCVYRYNVSINDGYRVKDVDGAFQEGKTLWLSGYQGQSKARKGPVNFYFYNNTIYCSDSLTARIAIDNTSSGVLIANNIFCLEGGAAAVLGDQYKPDTDNDELAENVLFEHNVFLTPASWPESMSLKDNDPLFGDPLFHNPGGGQIEDYLPNNRRLLQRKGMIIQELPGDSTGRWLPLQLEQDILGKALGRRPSIGAVEPN